MEFYGYAASLADYGTRVGESVGDAHTRHITLSEPYYDQQEKLGLNKEYVEAESDDNSKQGGMDRAPDPDELYNSVWRGFENRRHS